MTESLIEWSFEKLKIKLPQQLTVSCSRKKQNEAKRQLLDAFRKYLKLKIKLPQQLTISCSRKKRNEAKRQLLDAFRKYLKQKPSIK